MAQNKVAAAEALARIEPNPDAIAYLSSVVDSQLPWPIRLQAINSLTFVGEQSKAALPAIRRATKETQEYLIRAARYLEAVLENRYTPTYPVFSLPNAPRA
jgi:HEAT repeat protein